MTQTGTCGCCGLPLDEIPHDLAFPLPTAYRVVPAAERDRRIQLPPSSRCGADWCVIDGLGSAFPHLTHQRTRVYLIRGVMLVPLNDRPGEHFGWGLWAEISEPSFKLYYDLAKVQKIDASDQPPFQGFLNTWPQSYPRFASDEVHVHLGSPSLRPEFRPTTFQDLMYREQRDGITIARWHEIVRALKATSTLK